MVWGAAFEVLFSKLFTIGRCKDVWVADHMQFHNGNIHWNIFFTKLVHDWEVKVVSAFFELLYSQRVRQRG